MCMVGKKKKKTKGLVLRDDDSHTENNSKQKINKFKVVMVGDNAVGKTSMLLKYIEGSFSENTISLDKNVDYFEKQIDSLKMTLELWDTAGQERFRTITTGYYRGSHGVVVVFDMSNRKSFENVKKWITDAKRVTSEGIIILVGNKTDINEWEVTHSDAVECAETFGVNYFETSCKTGAGIDDAFQDLAQQLKKVYD